LTAAEYTTVGAKGEKACTEEVPDTVRAKLLLELSTKRLLWQVKRETVPVILAAAPAPVDPTVFAVSAEVAGVKFPV
jgi:hypothetical protein